MNFSMRNMTKGRAIEIYCMVVIGYVVLGLLNMRGNAIGNLASQFVEPLLNPVSDMIGTDEIPSAIVLVIGLRMLKDRMGW